MGDAGENETMLKFVINVNTQSPDRILPYMEKITLMCLKIITDSQCRKLIDEPIRQLSASFIKNVIMASDSPSAVAKL